MASHSHLVPETSVVLTSILVGLAFDGHRRALRCSAPVVGESVA